MRIPTLADWNIEKPNELWLCNGVVPRSPPRFYKYIWKIWTPESQVEGMAFVKSDEGWMSMAEYQLMTCSPI